MFEETMYQTITRILMDNGATASKEAVNALIEYIAQQNAHLFNRLADDLSKIKYSVESSTRTEA